VSANSSIPSSSNAPSPIVAAPYEVPSKSPTQNPETFTPTPAPTGATDTPTLEQVVETRSPTTKAPTKNPANVFYPVFFPTYFPSSELEFMMTGFSTNSTVEFQDMSEPMDEETTAIFEQVVMGHLIDASLENDGDEHQVFISSVEVIEQNVIENEVEANYKRGRRLANTVLQIIIKVVGEIEPEAPESYIADVTVAIQDEFEDEEKHQELTKRLAKESSFFDSYYAQQNELVVAEAQRGVEKESSQPPWIVLIVCGCVAVAILVGSMFYMERRSSNMSGRRVARQDGFQHCDLSALNRVMGDEEMQRTMAPMPTPKSVQESRMKSIMDFDDEKVSVVA
jgi:hypothetical protein